jgi:hypothetical protein
MQDECVGCRRHAGVKHTSGSRDGEGFRPKPSREEFTKKTNYATIKPLPLSKIVSEQKNRKCWLQADGTTTLVARDFSSKTRRMRATKPSFDYTKQVSE